MIIAVDFDGTIVKNKWPEIGSLRFGAKWCLRWLNKRHKLILWTCRDTQDALKAANYTSRKTGVVFEYINENPPDQIDKFGNDPRKIGADLYLDDKAGFLGWWSIPAIILWLEWRERQCLTNSQRELNTTKVKSDMI
jgi:hypothetical protein